MSERLRYGETRYVKQIHNRDGQPTIPSGADVRVVNEMNDGTVVVNWQGRYLDVPKQLLVEKMS